MPTVSAGICFTHSVLGRHAVALGVAGRHQLEQRRVDAVGARGQEPELASALAAAAQERLGVLEVVAGDLAAEHALGRNGRAVRGDDQRDLAGGTTSGRDLDTRYCQRNGTKCQPGGSRRAWYPASPSSATAAPRPAGDRTS